MSATAFPSSAIGLPKSLDYRLEPSLSPDARSYWVAVQPDGVNSVSSSVVPLFSATAGANVVNAFNSQLLQFTIPSGTSKSVFIDCRETSLNFRMTMTTGTAAAGGAGLSLNLISSAQSFFDSLQIFSNNIPIEAIQGYNILANQLLLATVNSAEKFGGVSVAMGCDTNTATGVDLPITTGAGVQTVFNFSIPLISIIGLNNQDRLFPIGSVGNLALQMQTSALLPFCSYSTTAPTTSPTTTVVLDQFNLNMKYIDIGSASASLLHSTLPDGRIFMKCATWIQSAANIPSGTGGQLNLLYQIRNSSVKSLLFQNSQFPVTGGATPNYNTPNFSYDAVNLACTQFNVSVGGVQFPQRPMDPTRRPSEAMLYYLSALGYNGDYKKYGGYITRSAYGASTNVASVTQADSMMTLLPNNGTRLNSSIDAGTQVIAQFPNMHFLGIDLESSGGVLFNGYNTRSSAPTGNWYLNTPTSFASTSYCFALVDCVLVIDTAAQTIQAFV